MTEGVESTAQDDEARLRELLRVAPGSPVSLADRHPGATHGWQRQEAERATSRRLEHLANLQDRLWAEEKRAVLVVLQGIDASGKDGTIRRVMSAFNPQGCVVSSFRVPTAEELAHDYLWRVHRRVPAKGVIGVFNRSHYEDVLVVRVRNLVPEREWRLRYHHIREFERLLSETGTTIVKLMLHISRGEQRKRFQARYDDPAKRWKFRLGDLDVRVQWDDYMAAYEAALQETSTGHAPWYVVPADRKWFRDLAVATILAQTIEELRPDYPPAADLPADLVIE
ncbi:MAG TPA: PPK2 family polyphosphate kinase [Candidatus Limnocylindrales bacterium]|nr:PPK2 family polyphosphate kinase [Candidatus Limnocylindrales bacterium]